MITDEKLVFGLIMAIIGLVFYTASLRNDFFSRFYAVLPPIILCVFVPAALNTFGVFGVGVGKKIYSFSAIYFLPASLFLMTLAMDVKKLLGLGWKVLAMFLAASVGIIISAPIVLLVYKLISPELFQDDHLWKGFSTVAASWIGGAANQAAMKEVWGVSDQLFGAMLLVDTTNASIWLMVIFILARHANKIDRFLKADTKNIEQLVANVALYEKSHAKIPNLNDLMKLLGLTFAVSTLAFPVGTKIAGFFKQFSFSNQYSLDSTFFWAVIVVTVIGTILSFTKIRQLDEVGASKFGTMFIYILVATIGVQIDLSGVVKYWQLLLVGFLWIVLHIVFVFIVARIIKAPLFYLCVGSNANTGGASTAPIVATAFHPSLAPVGVLLGVLGYVIGTVGGYIASILMKWVVGVS